MQAGRGFLQARQQVIRPLHRQPLVIDALTVQSAQLFAVAGPPRPAVIALRHHDAVAAVGRSDCGIDQEQPAMARPDLLAMRARKFRSSP